VPTTIKLFLALCGAIAAWLIYSAIQTLYFPVTLPPITPRNPQLDDIVRQGEITGALVWIIQALLLVNLATLIVFARQAWLRYVVVFLILARYVWPASITLSIHALPLSQRWDMYIKAWWSSPASYVWAVAWILVIVLMFLPDTQLWFRKKTT